jgi:nucleotide-binding universal stress UspA family protein
MPASCSARSSTWHGIKQSDSGLGTDRHDASSEEEQMSDEGMIVVGVDGSDPSRTALEFALEEAARRTARVRAVIAFHPPESWPTVYGMAPIMAVPPSRQELAEAAERTIEQTVAEATARVAGRAPAVDVEVRVVPGAAAQVLVDQAADADLLVVGHRGRGGFASACLGSVGLQCVLHARCPVTVVRPSTTSTPGRAAAGAVAAGRPT